MNYLFNVFEEEKPIKKAPIITEECYRNGYHPSKWELAQVILNGIWKPYKFKSYMQYKSRERLNLQPDTQCPDAILIDDRTNQEVSIYDLFNSGRSEKSAENRPMVLICGSFT
ncbi:hypothetical protein ACTFIU_008173 [Dictyostelium citrinum]